MGGHRGHRAPTPPPLPPLPPLASDAPTTRRSQSANWAWPVELKCTLSTNHRLRSMPAAALAWFQSATWSVGQRRCAALSAALAEP